MGKKQDYLQHICLTEFGEGTHLKPSGLDLLTSEFSSVINQIYKDLGGQLPEPPTRFGSWDINLKEFIIELDEERHFNRYRLQTLNSVFYSKVIHFNVKNYRTLCSTFENECTRAASWGKNWQNDSTERQFGNSNSSSNLNGNGSSRWKQRAFYDFLKDVSSEILDIPVLRISIYDEIESYRIDELIQRKEGKMLLAHIKSTLLNNS